MVLNSCWKCCAYVAEEFGTIRSEEVVRTNLIGYARFRKYQIGKSDCLYKFPNIKSDNLILSDLIWTSIIKIAMRSLTKPARGILGIEMWGLNKALSLSHLYRPYTQDSMCCPWLMCCYTKSSTDRQGKQWEKKKW